MKLISTSTVGEMLSIMSLISMYIVNADDDKALYKVVSYNIKPYLFRDKKTGKMAGILPEVGKLTEFYCRHHFPRKEARLFDFAVMLDEVTDVHRLFNSNLSYGEGILQNITEQNAMWFPYFNFIEKDDLEMFRQRNTTNFNLLQMKSLVVIMQSWKVSVGYKFLLGLQNCHVLSFFTLCFSIVCAFLIWVLERKENENIHSGFYKGFGHSFYLVIVTLVTVGYGDIVPKRALSKLILIIWMLLGLLLSSLVTATVLDTINNKNALDINGKKVAVIEDSYELHLVEHNYNSDIIVTKSNEEAVEMVRSGDVFAAVMNADIASWYKNIILTDGSYSGRLSFVYTLPVRIPIPALVNRENPATEPIIECIRKYWSEIMIHSEESFKKFLPIETSRSEGLGDLHNSSVYLAFTLVTVLVLALGISYQHGPGIWKRIQNKTKQATFVGEMPIIHHPNSATRDTSICIKNNHASTKNEVISTDGKIKAESGSRPFIMAGT